MEGWEGYLLVTSKEPGSLCDSCSTATLATSLSLIAREIAPLETSGFLHVHTPTHVVSEIQPVSNAMHLLLVLDARVSLAGQGASHSVKLSPTMAYHNRCQQNHCMPGTRAQPRLALSPLRTQIACYAVLKATREVTYEQTQAGALQASKPGTEAVLSNQQRMSNQEKAAIFDKPVVSRYT